MEQGSRIVFIINILLWYGFTVLSTIYSKKYLNLVYDAHTLTLVSFLYAAFLRLISSPSDLVHLLKSADYISLALFNIGTILLTNIGMSETSVSLTYMVKVITSHSLSLSLLFLLITQFKIWFSFII